jgi:RNA polymerase sigma-70 factor (ECF subfamily)
VEAIQHISLATDTEVIDRVLSGDTAAFELLIRRYNPLLYKLARTYGLSHHDAEDVLQETHFAAYCQLKSFRADASYKTWLTKIHLHKCYHKVHEKHLKYEQQGDELITEQSIFMHTSGERQQTERAIMSRELGKVLEESLQQLPLIYRNVFVLREVEEFSVAETAEMLSITAVNVKVRLNRAKALLQKQLESYYSIADIYEFHLRYCDKIVEGVFERIADDMAALVSIECTLPSASDKEGKE